jgi:oligopeptide transport system ATP-binding protein
VAVTAAASDAPAPSQRTSGKALLEVVDLHVRFDTAAGTAHAVRGVGFSVGEGETLGIVGESGCGKSATILSLPRLLPPSIATISGGAVWFDGTDLLRADDRTLHSVRGGDIGVIFQDPLSSLNPVLRMHRQLTEGPRQHLGLSRREATDRALELLAAVGIPDPHRRLRQYPSEYSGGMRQRAMIAMALASEPRLLLADEPTTALDVTVQAQILALVRRLRDERGLSVVWVTHDLGIVAGLVDRVLVMYAGTIVEQADVRTIYRAPHHPYTQALLGSIPRVDIRRRVALPSIPGSPPSLLDPPPGCPFTARCAHRMERCDHERPSLRVVGEGHASACFLDITRRTPS